MTATASVTRDGHVTFGVTTGVSHATPTPPHPTHTLVAAFCGWSMDQIQGQVAAVDARGHLLGIGGDQR